MKNLLRYTILFLVQSFVFTTAFAQSAVAVEKVSITVSDLDKAISFYTQVLDFTKEEEYILTGKIAQELFGLKTEKAKVRIAKISLGNEIVELMEFSGVDPGRAIPPDSKSNDLWFQHIAIVVNNMDSAYKKIQQAKATHVSTSPQTLPEYLPAAAGISAFYFRDPDGHNLELINFPKGKGNPKWQDSDEAKLRATNISSTPVFNHSNSSLFLGIDHTAIGISSTDEAYTFWKDILKMEIGGHSENYGPEQEHLNQVFGARLFITGLHTDNGFGVEFLDYIAPPGGRSYPSDSNPTDLWHWHTTVKVSGLDQLSEQLLAKNFQFISKGIVQLDDLNKALMLRDPDGHAVMLIE